MKIKVNVFKNYDVRTAKCDWCKEENKECVMCPNQIMVPATELKKVIDDYEYKYRIFRAPIRVINGEPIYRQVLTGREKCGGSIDICTDCIKEIHSQLNGKDNKGKRRR